ncbi:MAG TPA: hypothetical protein VJU61_04800 [Polyangiaceae bacterium]|nr:hypothetical protein [Polyangiaceae bacterium]
MVCRTVGALREASPLALALTLCSCSGEKEPAETITKLELQPALNLGECSAAWVPITGGNRSDSEPPAELLFAAGDLFFFRFQWEAEGATSSELVRFDPHAPSRELATKVLVAGAYSAPIWVDDNELVFTQNGEVRSVPMAGGETRLRSSFGASGLGDTRWLGISGGNFYFARYGQPGAIWKISLGGGPVGLFANLGPGWGYLIEPPLVESSEGLLLSGEPQLEDGANHRSTIVISGDGGIREVATPEDSTLRPFLTPTGVIHIVEPVPPEAATKAEGSPKAEAAPKGEPPPIKAAASTTSPMVTKVPTSGGTKAEEKPLTHPDLQMWLAPLRGSALTEFWPDRPEAALPGHVESDGRDGWFVTATEPFNDGNLHDTLWHVRPNAAARRLACNPSPESAQIQTESRMGHAFASGDGSVYLVSLRGQSEFWELVQISYLQPEDQR